MAKNSKRGRPSLYSAELAATICKRLSEGESLREICRDDGLPDRGTILRWAEENEEFRHQYARAREALLEYWAHEIVEISDDGSNDYMERQGKKGETFEVVDHEHISRSKLRVDTRKWLMSKLAPKKYGDRVAAEISGPDGGPIEITGARERLAHLVDRQAAG